MGYPRLSYGELPDGKKVAEISIPVPVISESVNSLKTAGFIQGFTDIAQGYFESLEELPRTAMQYFEYPSDNQGINLACPPPTHFKPLKLFYQIIYTAAKEKI